MPFPLFVLVAFSIAGATLATTYVLAGRATVALGAALAGAFGLLVFHGPGYFNHFPVDDAYITFRYSQHLADGLGPDWNSTGHVEGYSSFLWMVLLAGMNKLGLDILDAARLLAYLTTLGTMLAVLAIWRLWSRDADDAGLRSPLVPAIALIAIAVVDGVAFWSFSGLETPLYMFLLTAGALVAMRERRISTIVPWSALIFVAVALTRPEGVIAAAVTGIFVLDGVQDAPTRRRALLRAGLWAGTFALLYGIYFTWRFSYYDHLFPNTYYAKTERTLAVYERGSDYLMSAALSYQLFAAFIGAALLAMIPVLRRDAAYVGVLTGVLLLALIPEGGDAFGHGRMIVPVVPLLAIAGVSGFTIALQRLPLPSLQRSAGAAVALAVLCLLLLRASDNPFLPEDRQDHTERKALGLWLDDYAPYDFTIAAWAIGSVAYHSERDALDLFGLNDEVIAHTKIVGFGTGIAGHERYNVDYVIEVAKPEIIVTGDAVPAALDEAAFWQQFAGTGGLQGKLAVLRDPRLQEMYAVRAIEIDGRWYNFLQRKDTLAQLQAPGLR